IIQFPPINYQFSADKGWQPLAGGAVTQKQAVAVNPEDLTLADAVKNGLFWFTGFSFFLTIFGGLMAVSQLAAFAGAAPPVGIGLAPLITATVIQAKAVNNGLGRPVWGWVAGKIGPKNALITVALFMALSLYVLSISESRAMVTLGAALVGLSFGGALALNPVIATFMFGPSYIARIYGLIFFMGFGFGGFFGPRVGGLLFTATGSYDAPFLLAAGLAITSAVLSALIFPAKGKEKQRRSQELVKAA
ncbi:MFS transporter, partial [Candidatus Hakubella thermalkaliphila]